MYLVGKLIGHRNLVGMCSWNCRRNSCLPLKAVLGSIGLVGRGCSPALLHCYIDSQGSKYNCLLYLHFDRCQQGIFGTMMPPLN